MKKLLPLLLLVTVFSIHPETIIPLCEFENLSIQNSSIFLNKVKQISVSGSPGHVSVFGEHAFPILTNSEGVTLAAGAHYGKGRIVVSGRSGFLYNYLTEKNNDTTQLLANALNWLTQNKDKPRILTMYKTSSSTLDALKIKHTYLSALPELISSYDCIILAFDKGPDLNDYEIEKLQNFVKHGGSIYATGAGWVYHDYQKETQFDSIREDFSGNKLLRVMGLEWTIKYSNEKPVKVINSQHNTSHLLHIINVIIKIINSEQVPFKTDQITLYLDKYHKRLNDVESFSQLLTNTQITAIFKLYKEMGKRVIPSAEKPFAVNDIKAAFLMMLISAIADNPGVIMIDELHHTADFPGKPLANTFITKTMCFNLSYSKWHSTGIYAVAGKPISIYIHPESGVKRVIAQIGCHDENLFTKDSWSRWPDIMVTKSLSNQDSSIVSPHGGLLYFIFPGSGNQTTITECSIQISGGVEAPTIIYGETTNKEWNEKIKKFPGAWGEIITEYNTVTIPACAMRKNSDAERIAQLWQKTGECYPEISGITPDFKQRVVTDRQHKSKYMHSGYPVMTLLDVVESYAGNEEKFFIYGNYKTYHEWGHNHQKPEWTPQGTGETTSDFFMYYVTEKIFGKGPVDYFGDAPYLNQINNALKEKPDPSNFPKHRYAFFVTLPYFFGWDAMGKFFREFHTLDKNEKPISDQHIYDQYCMRLSRLTGYNLAPYFTNMGIILSKPARKSNAHLPVWTPKDLERLDISDLTDKLIAEYGLNGNVVDSCPNNYHGWLPMTPPVPANDRFNRTGKAYFFNGSNNYLQLNTQALFLNKRSFTLSLWLKTSKPNQIILQQTSRAKHRLYNELKLYLDPTGKISLLLGGNKKGSQESLVSAQPVIDNQWHHVAVTRATDESEEKCILKLFIDGKLNHSVNTSVYNIARSAIWLGLGYDKSFRYYHGALDDLKMYERALDENEIKKMYLEDYGKE